MVEAGFAGVLAGVPAGVGFGAVVPGVVVGDVPVPLVPVTFVGAGAAGNTVIGVGSGGNGLVKMPATSSVIPSVLSAFLNLYQVVRLSCQTGFCAVNLASVPESATARA